MHKITENGILDREEFEAYKAHSVQLKFRAQLLSGIGSSTVFGIIGFATAHLLGLMNIGGVATAAQAGATAAAAATGIVWWPLMVIGAMAVVGVAAIYFSNRYYTESFMLDQDFNARKIGKATSLAHVQLLEQQNALSAPFSAEAQNAKQETSWAARVNKAHTQGDWADRAQAAAAAETSIIKGA